MNKQTSAVSDFWMGYLQDAYEYRLSSFPVNALRGSSSVEVTVPAAELNEIRKAAGDKDFNVLKIFLGALGILLWKHAPQDNFIIAMPPVLIPDVDPANSGTWFCKLKTGEDLSVRSLLDQVHEFLQDAYDHYEYDEMELRSALTAQAFNLSGLTSIGFRYNKLNASGNWLNDQQLLFELIEEDDAVLRVTTRLYKHQEALLKSLAESFINIAYGLLKNREKPIAACSLVSKTMCDDWFVQFGKNARSYPRDVTVIDLFLQHVKKYPQRTALLYNDNAISYLELNKRSDEIAFFISQHLNKNGNRLVGIQMERSSDMIMTVLGILKAGAAYVPIDKEYPPERIQEIIEDAGLSLVITDGDPDMTVPGNCCFVPASSIPVSAAKTGFSLADPDGLAYVIYSSGTTGKPKGIMIGHRAIMNLLFWYNERYAINEHTRIIQLTNLVVDIAFQEIFSAFINGLTLYVPTQPVVQDKTLFIHYLTENKINFIQLIPDMMSEYLLDIPKLEFLDQILCGGDKLNDVLKDKILAKGYQLFNVYGQTETAIDTVAAKCAEGEPSRFNEYVPNYEVLILDQYGNLCPEFLPGEICTAGIGLANGYLNLPELTKEKFRTHPFKKDERIYHTGDIGKRLPGGSIEITGRKDLQVKIHGFRVELTEIEGNLVKYPGVTEANVIVKENQGEKMLIAYIVTSQEQDEQIYKAFLSGFLPRHMLPQYIRVIDKMPLTPVGKVDRAALATLDVNTESKAGDIVSPRNGTEAVLQQTWSEVLKMQPHLISVTESFFALGGDSIKAIRLISAINKKLSSQLTVKDVYYSQDIATQALLIEASKKKNYHQEGLKLLGDFKERFFAEPGGIEKLPVDWEDVYPMTAIQQGMVYHNLLEPTHYFDQNFYQFEYAGFNEEVFRQVLKKLIGKHEIFRTSFHMTRFNEPVQVVHRMSDRFNLLVVEDLRAFSKEEQVTYLEGFKQKDLHTPFILDTSPLWRFRLFRTGDKEYLFFMTIFHAIIDGWSSAVFLTELENGLAELKHSGVSTNQTLKSHQKDYVAEQLAIARDRSFQQFWKNAMTGYQRTPLPFSNTVVQQKDTRIAYGQIDETLFTSLERKAKVAGVNLKTLHLCAYALLLKYTTGQEDITFGIESNNRPDTDDSDQLIGCFLNTVPFRINLETASKTGSLITQVAQSERNLKAYDKLPLSEIVQACGIKTAAGENPFFDLFFAYHDFHAFENLSSLFTGKQSVIDDHDTNNFLFTLNVSKRIIKISGFAYTAESMKRLVDYYMNILELLAGDPDVTVTAAKIIGREELNRLVYDFNATEAVIPENKTVLDFFEEQVKAVPDKIALSFNDSTINYRGLNETANAFAGYLKDRYKIGEGDLVGIMLERSEWMIISLLGILKAGAAYVPLDSSYPAERINYIVSDSECSMVITPEEIHKFRQCEDRFADAHVSVKVQPHSPAYVIYTSGSTGLPKGVLITHLSVVNLIQHQRLTFGITNTENILQFSSLSFDASVEQIFLALSSGACLTLIDKDTILDMDKLGEFIAENKITHLHAVPRVLEMLTAKSYPDLRRVISGGDKCSPALAEKWGSHCNFYNEYGPTETTVTSIEYRYMPSEKAGNILPIGKPIGNTFAYILDKKQEVCPIGVTGELYIGGKGLAKAYLNRPELTAEKFIENPFRQNERVYKSGDLCRWLPDGTIEFMGRNDTQVKIRGFRIELGEIEKVLQQYPGIENAVAKTIIDKNNETGIAAYITSGQTLKPQDLKAYLSEKLPAFMLPAYYVQVEQMPLTSSGKIDVQQLPYPEEQQLKNETEYIAPANETEQQLTLLWQRILGREKIGTTADFFESGGHSLSLTRLLGQIHKELDVKLDVSELFKNTTIKEQAELIARSRKSTYTEIPLSPVQGAYPLSYPQKRLWLLSQFDKGSEAYTISSVQKIVGKPDLQAIDQAFLRLIERHETLRTVFRMNEKGEISQIVLPAEKINFKMHRQNLENAAEPETELKACIEKNFSEPFDLTTGPLLRATFYQLRKGEAALCFEMHHIISDGWSVEILSRELFQLYNAFVSGEVPEMHPLKIQYKDYAMWQNEMLSGKRLNELIGYWKNRLGDAIPQLDLPLDYKRPEHPSFEGSNYLVDLPEDLSAALQKLAENNHTTLFTVLLAAYNVFLYKITNQRTLIVGTTVAGRGHSDLENLIGIFVNTLALKTELSSTQSFTDLVSQTHAHLMEDYRNQELPFEVMQQALERGENSTSPVFTTRLVLQDFENQNGELGQDTENAICLEEVEFDWKLARFELSTQVGRRKNNLTLMMEYRSDLFKRSTIERFTSRFITLLSNIVKAPEMQLSDLEFLSDEEKEKLEKKKKEKMKNQLSLLKK